MILLFLKGEIYEKSVQNYENGKNLLTKALLMYYYANKLMMSRNLYGVSKRTYAAKAVILKGGNS